MPVLPGRGEKRVPTGEVPADGEVRLGGVRLPAGRRICAGTPAAGFDEGSGIAWMAEQEAAAREYARAHPGVPLLWATDEPVPEAGRVWHELHEMAPQTGLVPITLAFLHGQGSREADPASWRGRPWDSGECGVYPLADADEADPVAVLADGWTDSLDPRSDDPEQRDMIRPFSWEFPGLAPASDDPLGGAELDAALAMIRPARLGLVPAARPSDVLSLTGFTGFTNKWGTPAEFTAVLRTWEERFGAVLFEVGFAHVRVLVTRPPRTRRATELVAAEIYAVCDEFWPIERPGTALWSVGDIADYVKDAPFWGFWWD
jgi:hypothetical protein